MGGCCRPHRTFSLAALVHAHALQDAVHRSEPALADGADVVVVTPRHDVVDLLLRAQLVGDPRVHVHRDLVARVRLVVVRTQLRHAVGLRVPALADVLVALRLGHRDRHVTHMLRDQPRKLAHHLGRAGVR